MSAGGVRVMFSPLKTMSPGARRRQARDRAQRRRLAGPVGADERDALALLDRQRDALQRLDVAVVRVDVVDLEHRHQSTTALLTLALGLVLAEVRLDHQRIVADRLRVALGELLAVVQDGDVLRDPHDDLHVVLDEQDRDAELVAQALHEAREVRGLLRVHPGGRLVEQQQLGLGRQRPRDLDAALVAVGEVRGELVVQARLQADVRQHLGRLLAHLALLPADPRRPEDRAEQPGLHPRVLADHDVLERRHRPEQADVLERPRDAERHDLVRPRRR